MEAGVGIGIGLETGKGSAELTVEGMWESGMGACIGFAKSSAAGMGETGMELGIGSCIRPAGVAAGRIGKEFDKFEVMLESGIGKTDVESRIGVVTGVTR
nr:hypothetical protein CFP56_37425 [Quercus suber]